MKKIELLSPAGNMESLKAAIEAGCDAIYLGGTMFSARAFANNFTNTELIQAIKYCHLYGVKVYVTCNILIYEHEVDKFIEYVSFLHQNNVDAILVQDIGMADLIHQKFPNLELHASTQMHIHNLDGVEMAKKLGFSRVVLARETPIEVIEDIIKKTNVDIEVFAHGSLYVSYSGQCLFSSLIGHRSGNRGSCVGSCRLPYNIVDEHGNKLNKGSYPLSMKDLNTLEDIGRLIDCGVTSLKIEGRMKSPEYVYTVTKLYRMAIDNYYKNKSVYIDEKELLNLQKIFNRSYTKGYLFHENASSIINDVRGNHQGIYLGKVIDYQNNWVKIQLTSDVSIHDGLRIILDDEDYGIVLNEFYIDKKIAKVAHANDIISLKVHKFIPKNSIVLLTKDSSLIEEIDEKINNKERKVLVDIKVKANLDKPLWMEVNDGINKVSLNGPIVLKALNHPTSEIDIKDKLNKCGDTVYKINHLYIELSDNIFLPFKIINELRHNLLKELDTLRIGKSNYKEGLYKREVPIFAKQKLKSVLVSKIVDKLNYDIVYSENANDEAIIKLPKVMDNYNGLNQDREYLIGEIGGLHKLKNVDTDYSFNVVNSYSVALLQSLGVKRVTLSLELNEKQIENLVNAYLKRYNANPNLEVIKFGKREVMTLKTCLNKVYKKDKLFLQDRFKNNYLIRQVNNLSYIYEPKRYVSSINYYDLGINVVRDNKEV